MTGARVLVSIPLILAGKAITDLGYIIAGANHLNPHRRSS